MRTVRLRGAPDASPNGGHSCRAHASSGRGGSRLRYVPNSPFRPSPVWAACCPPIKWGGTWPRANVSSHSTNRTTARRDLTGGTTYSRRNQDVHAGPHRRARAGTDGPRRRLFRGRDGDSRCRASSSPRDVMRPIGQKLDVMSAEDVVAADSPLWQYLAALPRFRTDGLRDARCADARAAGPHLPADLRGTRLGRFGPRDPGARVELPVADGACARRRRIEGTLHGRAWLLARHAARSRQRRARHRRDRGAPGYAVRAAATCPLACVGDEYIINGQSSAWVSGAPIAQNALAYIPCDYGDGLYTEHGGLHHVGILVPVRSSRRQQGQAASEKLGQRPLPQGEVFFNEVRVPAKYAIAARDQAVPEPDRRARRSATWKWRRPLPASRAPRSSMRSPMRTNASRAERRSSITSR